MNNNGTRKTRNFFFDRFPNSPYLGGTLALAGAVHAGAAATLLQLLALVQLGAVCRGVALPGLLHAVVTHTEAVVWVVSTCHGVIEVLKGLEKNCQLRPYVR